MEVVQGGDLVGPVVRPQNVWKPPVWVAVVTLWRVVSAVRGNADQADLTGPELRHLELEEYSRGNAGRRLDFQRPPIMGLLMACLGLLEGDSSKWVEGQVRIPSHWAEVVPALKSKDEQPF